MQIVSGRQSNGAVLQAIALMRSLVRRGHEITLLCRHDAWVGEQIADEPIEVICSDLHRWPTDELRRVASIVRSREIDVLHTHMSRAHGYGVLLRWFAGTPCIASAHCRRLQPHWMFNDYVIANSQATLRYHRRWNRVAKDRIEVVPYLIDFARFDRVSATQRREVRTRLGLDDGTPLIGIIGDVRPCKGHIYLVRGMPYLLDRVPGLRLAVVGNSIGGYQAKVQREAERLGVADSIVWTGYREDIPAVLSALDVCVSASLEEPLGLTMPEALAMGRAVVATNVGGLPETVIPGETGLLVPPRRPRPLARAIATLLTDEQLRSDMGAAGRRHVHQMYQWERDVDRVEAIFRRVAGISMRSSPATV
jgi:glycosyltransferase involved in cell wall biosynthesis